MDKKFTKFLKFYQRKVGKQVKLYTSSVVRKNKNIVFLIREGFEKKLIVAKENSKPTLQFTPEREGKAGKFFYCACPCTCENAKNLRKHFSYTRAQLLGLNPSIGTGDRIGLATPAHIRASKKFGLIPTLAQQSIREMQSCERSATEVLDDVSWSAFQEGYREGFGADADHLKTKKDITRTSKAGFTMFTIDPSDYINNKAESYRMEKLEEKFNNLPWYKLGRKPLEILEKYVDKEFDVSGLILKFDKKDLLKVAVKFLTALVHVKKLVSYLRKIKEKFDLEISIDEAKTPTTLKEHFFIASEIKSLGIKIRSLAPKFVGKFEKAIDYNGDISKFEQSFKKHLLIAKKFGYLISIHSGSDKFSIYPIIGKSKKFHLKTAGTSYLEALRVIARNQPDFFRKLVRYSIKKFRKARKNYKGLVSASISEVPDPQEISDKELKRFYLGKKAGRQIMHIAYGPILKVFKEKIKKILLQHEDEFYETVKKHIERHLKCLSSTH